MSRSGREQGRAIIVSASSDVGAALGCRWLASGWDVAGTFRTPSAALGPLRDAGARLIRCDLNDADSVRESCRRLCEELPDWDALVLCPGMLEPVGSFSGCDFDAWEQSVRVNLTGPLRVLHGLLPVRRRGGDGPCVLFFAGGGTNDAPVNYSAYTTAKVALVKACELLDAEVPDTRFVILGTGWVKTKIHEATLRAGELAGANYQRTLEKLAGPTCTPMGRVLDFCDWALGAPRGVVSGRNFSVANDLWGTPELAERLADDPTLYKLRRSGNNWRPRNPSDPGSPRMDHSPILDGLLGALPAARGQHSPACDLYGLLKQVARREVESLFRSADEAPRGFGPFGRLAFPYVSMGAVDSLSLFDLDELILFSFYNQNRGRYRRVLDVGANVGLHSVVLSRCGFEVRCFEPDPTHFRLLRRNLTLNGCATVTPHNAAVSSGAGTLEFVRVLGNTTGSHLAGAKPSPYGELERFPVRVEAIGPLLEWADLVKMDVEGHEAEILLSTQRRHWVDTDGVVEIGSADNARRVFDHFRTLGVGMFAQKNGWRPVAALADVPASYRDGSLFISCKDEMPWGEATAAAPRKAS
jgi:FkbM family methyltransferase